MKLSHILLATDLTPASATAVEAASALAGVVATKITLVHVRPTEPADISHLGGPPPPDEELKDELKQQMAALREAALEDVRDVSTKLLAGRDPADVICAFAQRSEVDLIIVGTNARTGLSRVLMGSVATDIVKNASCPVLVARPKQQDESS